MCLASAPAAPAPPPDNTAELRAQKAAEEAQALRQNRVNARGIRSTIKTSFLGVPDDDLSPSENPNNNGGM